MSIYLYLNTGSVNHGCEAIVRSTCKILDTVCGKQDKILASSNIEQDQRFHLDEIVDIVPAGMWKNVPQHTFYYVMRKITHNSKLGMRTIFNDFLKKLNKNDVALCIGGDTYCYTYPEYLEVCLDYIKRVGAKSVLWTASIEPSAMTKRMIDHLNMYDYIVVREELSYCALLNKGIPSEKILKSCDPAFHLPVQKINLPQKFDRENTVGLNVSGLVAGTDDEKTKKAFDAISTWLQNLLETTDYKVCLIPHVYGQGTDGRDDSYYITALYNGLSEDKKNRVAIVSKELSCTELKYIISQCRFFIGARTHSIIAAYSTGVPAIALGYSVKADGIATDLFGTTDNFVLNNNRLQNWENLKSAFTYLVEHENQIREIYASKLPPYKDTILRVTNEIINDKEKTSLDEI